ncbi:MAG TPA: hypothetical protein VI215_11775 [Bacteroidota bacterium]|jgi:hypothetical protein
MRGTDWSFPRQVLITLLVVACGAAYPLMKYGTAEILRAVLAGAAITTMNVLAGYAAIEYSHGKSASTFLKYVLGGMGVRLMAVAAVLVALIRVFGFEVSALVWSMVFFYVIFLILELMFIQKKFGNR